jgi:hypothetical protein
MTQRIAFPLVKDVYNIGICLRCDVHSVPIAASSRDPLRFARLLRNGLHVSLQQQKLDGIERDLVD